MSANGRTASDATKFIGLLHLGEFSETPFADAGDHLIGRRHEELA